MFRCLGVQGSGVLGVQVFRCSGVVWVFGVWGLGFKCLGV